MRMITPGPNPWGDGRAFKRGDDAWPILALQVALNRFPKNRLELDGVFGPQTEKVVKSFQSHRGMTADGIAGPATQEVICRRLSDGPERDEGLPRDLLRGLGERESSFMLACYSPHIDGEGFDLGAYQDAYDRASTQADYGRSLDVAHMAVRTAGEIRARHDTYRGQGAAERLAWECAALGHNWPVAATRMARGQAPTSNADQPAAWVESYSGGRLHTPREWVEDYVRAVTRFVRW